MNPISMNEKDINFTIALVGRPNVGKSTLFNRLTHTRDALIDSTPGVTRDRRYGILNLDGIPITLIDTGGLETEYAKSPDIISKAIFEQAMKAVAEANLILFVVDGRDGLIVADYEIFDRLRSTGKPILLAANKMDASSHSVAEFYELGVNEVIPISSAHGLGIPQLLQTIYRCIKKTAPELLTDMAFTKEDEQDISEADGLRIEQSDAHFPDTRPMRVALIGRPNVGKSSLLNRLVGYERMIVSDIPGTTRDAIDTLVQRYGKPDIIFTDTAGIRKKARVKDRLEKFSLLKALEAIRTSDIVLVLLDSVEGVTDQDKRLIGYVEEHGRGCITLYNKWDLIKNQPSLVKLRRNELEMAKGFISYTPHLDISAKTGWHVDHIYSLLDSIFQEFNAKFKTAAVNQALREAMARRSPPISKGHYLKLYYTTQIGSAPPTFLIFANYPDMLPDYYIRFLTNQFREHLGIKHIPIRLRFKQRERRQLEPIKDAYHERTNQTY